MKGKDTKIPMPLRGVDKTQAAGKQRTDTTFDAENVRSVDPTNKRVRITQRPGMEKHYPYAMPGPVRAVASLVYANKLITYEATEDEIESNGDGRTKHTEVWKKITEQKKDVRNIAVAPISGNVYALSGNAVEKRNGSGVLQWAYSVKLANKAFRLSPMALGADGAIHVAVDGGSAGPQGAAIYRIRQKVTDLEENSEPLLEWKWTTDAWVRELKVVNGQLKALVQFDDKRRSYIWTFTNISAAVPVLLDEVQVPYPSTCMDIDKDGSSISGHPYYALRDTTPGKPGVGISLESWTPYELDNFSSRVWEWWRAEDVADIYDHGTEVPYWSGRTGNGRDWTVGIPEQGAGVVRPGPTMNLKSSLGRPTLEFDGTQGLFSKPGGGIFADRDSCMSAVPNHGDGAYCIMIVCRPATATDPGEKDADGKPIDERRFLFNQFHQRKYAGTASAYFDSDDTRAFCSGIIVNSTTVGVPDTDDDLYCWGRSDSIAGLAAPGYARPYTPSSGYRFSGTHDADGYAAGAWTAGTSDFDWPGMPVNRGAGLYGWPKEGQFADVSSTAGGSEGWCVMTLLFDGGLNEHFEVTGTVTGATTFTPDDSQWLPGISNGTACQVYLGTADTAGSAVGANKANGGVLTLGTPVTDGTYTARAVFDRNLHTRCVWRINGQPVDRWEGLPMGYRGPSTLTTPTVADRTIDKNVDLQATGLGIPWALGKVKPFVGEIAEIIVFGNRQDASDGITLGSDVSYAWPTVLEHPKYAANSHAVLDTVADQSWTTTANAYLSTEMEKLEGYFMHRFGIASKLQSATANYPHPHYPGYVPNKTHDLPLTTEFPSSGQAWPARLKSPEAMLVKHDASGRMLWCLHAANVNNDGTGDLFRRDLTNYSGAWESAISGVTDAPATSGVAIGLDGDVFVAGPGSSASGGSHFCMGRIIDDPDTTGSPSIDSVGWYHWTTPYPADTYKANFVADETIRCVTDEFGNFYVPFAPGTQYVGFDAKDALRAYDPTGTLMFRLTTLNHGSASYQGGYAVAFPPTSPEYNLDE